MARVVDLGEGVVLAILWRVGSGAGDIAWAGAVGVVETFDEFAHRVAAALQSGFGSVSLMRHTDGTYSIAVPEDGSVAQLYIDSESVKFASTLDLGVLRVLEALGGYLV